MRECRGMHKIFTMISGKGDAFFVKDTLYVYDFVPLCWHI